MHDWWLALLASAVGTTGYVEEATMDYRQHGNNVVGAKDGRSLQSLVKKTCNTDIRSRMERSFRQAEMLLDCFCEYMSEVDRQIIENYTMISSCGWFKRRVMYIKGGYLMNTAAKRFGQIILG